MSSLQTESRKRRQDVKKKSNRVLTLNQYPDILKIIKQREMI
jgi:hypothetical protein